ncbi:MAG TPA: hypothetical protein VGG74_23155 [Kofleriaceae bacterium]|jgi:hypothetical protein
MGYDVAVFGELALPANASAAWKKLDATPSKRGDWPDGFGVPVTARGSVGTLVTQLAKPPQQAWGWQFSATASRVAIRGVMPDDCWLDNARLIAQLWLRGGEVGATGTLSFRGFETADTGWIVEAGKRARIKLMTKADKAIADASPDMAKLHDAMTETLAALPYNPFTSPKKKPKSRA